MRRLYHCVRKRCRAITPRFLGTPLFPGHHAPGTILRNYYFIMDFILVHSLEYHGLWYAVVGGNLPWYLSSHSAPSCGETRPLDHGMVLYPLTRGSLLSATYSKFHQSVKNVVYTKCVTIVTHTRMTTLRNCIVALYTSDISMWLMSFFAMLSLLVIYYEQCYKYD